MNPRIYLPPLRPTPCSLTVASGLTPSLNRRVSGSDFQLLQILYEDFRCPQYVIGNGARGD